MKMIEKLFWVQALCWLMEAPPAQAAPASWHCAGEQGLLLGSTVGYCYRFTRGTHLEAGLGLRDKGGQRAQKRRSWRKWHNYSPIGTCTLQHALLQGGRITVGLGYGPSLGWKIVDLKGFVFAGLRLAGPLALQLKGGGKLCCWRRQRGVKHHLDAVFLLSLP